MALIIVCLLFNMASDQNKTNIVIFKAPSESVADDKDAYYETFVSAGFQVTLVPVLDFEFCNLDQLLKKIKNPNCYSGIIFSSPRCVQGVQAAVSDDTDVLNDWKDLKNFVVGESTSRLVEELGLSANGKEAGNGNALADIIAKDKYEKPFLYPIGSLTQKTFQNKLKEIEIETDDIVIYKTKPHPSIGNYLKKIKQDLVGHVAYFIYFSPSGVNFTLPVIQELYNDFEKIKFVAIGPSTENALKEKGLTVAGTANKPNPASLLETVKRIEESTSK